MDDKKREKIIELSKVAHKARVKFECLSMMNTAQNAEDREKQRVEYDLARAEMFEANYLLDKEVGANGTTIMNRMPTQYEKAALQPEDSSGLAGWVWPFG